MYTQETEFPESAFSESHLEEITLGKACQIKAANKVDTEPRHENIKSRLHDDGDIVDAHKAGWRKIVHYRGSFKPLLVFSECALGIRVWSWKWYNSENDGEGFGGNILRTSWQGRFGLFSARERASSI